VVLAIDPWPHSEVGRFHRGISLSVITVAALILTAEPVRYHDPLELLVLGAALAATVTLARHMHKAFRASPANFPAVGISPTEMPAEPVRSGYRKSREARR
jgi:hypothetical protein